METTVFDRINQKIQQEFSERHRRLFEKFLDGELDPTTDKQEAMLFYERLWQ